MSRDTKHFNANSSSDESDGDSSEFENIPTPSTGRSESDGGESDFSHLTDLEEEETDTEEKEEEKEQQRNDTPVPDEEKERLEHIKNLEAQLYDAQFDQIGIEMKLKAANSKISGLEEQMADREAYFKRALKAFGKGPAKWASAEPEGALGSSDGAIGSSNEALRQALLEAGASKAIIRNLKAQIAARNLEISEKGHKIDELQYEMLESQTKIEKAELVVKCNEQLEEQVRELRLQAYKTLDGPEGALSEKIGELMRLKSELDATNQQIGMMYEQNELEKAALQREHAEVVADKDREIEELNATILLMKQW